MIEQIQNIFSEIENKARQEGAQVELILSNSENFAANYLKGRLNKYSFDNSVSAGIRVLYGRGSGFSTTENTSKEALMLTFQEALRSGKDLDKEALKDGLPQTLYRASDKPEDMNLWSREIDSLQIPEKLKMAELLEKAALQHDPRIQNVPYSNYGETKSQKWLMSSTGLSLDCQAAGISAFAYALSKSGDDLKAGIASGFFRNPQKLNPEKMAIEAAEKSIGLLGATQPKSGKYAVILSNDVMSQLLGELSYHLSAKSLDEGTSLFKDKLGENLFSEKITVTDDPFLMDQSGARPYDAEGAPSQKTVAIENGNLKSFFTNSYLAEKLDLPHTRNAVRSGGEMDVGFSNLIMSAGDSSFEDLLQSYQQVVLITAVDALHSGYKETTLDFSLPAYGYLYEYGERVRPLHQMVMSGNLLQVLRDAEKISDRYNNRGGPVLAPDVLVPGMSLAGA